MRTTVTIDDELLAQVKVIAVRSHRTIGSVLEDALRSHIAAQRPAVTEFRLPRFDYAHGGVQQGVDLLDKEQLAELEGEHVLP